MQTRRVTFRNLFARLVSHPVAPYLGAFLVYGAFAWIQIGYDSPDEHFPTLEAAGFLLFGYFEQTWEWGDGLRSWIQPLILAGWMKPLVWLGVTDRILLDHWARSLLALLALITVYAVGSLAWTVTGATKEGVLRARWGVAFAWPLVLFGTRHGSDTFVIPFLYLGFAWAFSESRKRALAGGMLLGFSFLLRFPAAVVLFPGLVLGFRYWRRNAFVVACAALAVFCAGTLFDGWMHERWAARGPKWPVWEFFRFNVLQGSGAFHRSGWWEPFAYSALLWAPVFGWLGIARRMARGRLEELRAAAWPLLTWFAACAAFAFVNHHEFRFLLPTIPLLVLASAPLPVARASHFLNAAFLLFFGVFYADPRASLVRSIAEGTSRAVADGAHHRLFVHDVTGTIPQFYSHRGFFLHPMDREMFRRECAGETAGTPRSTEKFALILTPHECRAPACSLLAGGAVSRYHRARERFLGRPPRAIRLYRCAATLKLWNQ